MRFSVIYSVLLWTPVICFGPAGRWNRPALLAVQDRVPVKLPTLLLHHSDQKRGNDYLVGIPSVYDDGSRRQQKVVKYSHHFIICAILLGLGAIGFPLSCLASSTTTTTTNRVLSIIPTISDLRSSLISILDSLSHSGTTGMAIYAFSFIIWTMTVGVTTPIETAAGMAYPLRISIPLSAIGKIGGAFFQYALAKYLFSEYARKKMEGNEWIDKINGSFQSNPYKVALIWRFSPLPEFVKNIGPAIVPTLKTRYQILATITHGLPFTILWSCIGNEAARVARGVSFCFTILQLLLRSLFHQNRFFQCSRVHEQCMRE